MKTFVLAALFAVAAAYDESEGPTKADNGDADFTVVYRESDVKNGEKFSGWTNPLSWTDDGAADDSVVLQIKDKLALNKHKHREEDVSELDSEPVMKFGDFEHLQEGAWVNLNTLRKHSHKKHHHVKKSEKDEYDGDKNTVSQYDADPHHKHGDFGVPKGQHGELKPVVYTQKAKKSADAYDGDENTVSEFDAGDKFRTFDWGVPAGQHGEYKEPVW